ncbi:type II secretion system protein [Vibrio sp. CK2-1]|uniref:type IV pilus modification PilV family protein n=1 Tax=Vibrio sp. CK2-1 TaxID=2912249 RepID=UPI001F222C3C|nr:type II secretion system protein [Vibrio sp. CK2-1]MCF7353830.1 type II secretion system GspH family protein [Vibrio sp. CK2-1]
MNNKGIKQNRQAGFTLIESIVAMVVMGIAMTILFSVFFPRVEDSGRPQYIVRASALGQSVMNTILSRSFDEASDPSGSIIRCDDGDNPDLNGDTAPICIGAKGRDSEDSAADFNDVDDYIGCWETDNKCTDSEIGSESAYLLSDLIPNTDQYPHFKVVVDVIDVANNGAESLTSSELHTMKKVTLTVSAQGYESIRLVGYKGNY